MTTVSIEEAGMRLRELVKLAAAGERVVILGEGTDRVELKAEGDRLATVDQAAGPRRAGLLEGTLVVGPEFFEPLPEDDLKLWNCEK